MQKALPATFFSPIIRHPTIMHLHPPPTYDALTNYDAFPPLTYDAPANYYPPPSYPPAVYGWVFVRPTSCGNYWYWNGEYCADARNGLPYVGPKW
jgi:hypothetical protein